MPEYLLSSTSPRYSSVAECSVTFNSQFAGLCRVFLDMAYAMTNGNLLALRCNSLKDRVV